MKKCTKCGQELPLDKYYRATREKDGLTCWCKLCHDEYAQEYRKTHRDEIRIRNKNYVSFKYNTDINYKIKHTLRNRFFKAVKRNQKKGSIISIIGCPIAELKYYIENKFLPGMTWDNWGINGWHIDHIRPLITFDLSELEQQIIAFNYTNLQPLWADANRKKPRGHNAG